MEESKAILASYRGKPIKELSKEELIEALNVMDAYYEKRIEGLLQTIELLKRSSTAMQPIKEIIVILVKRIIDNLKERFEVS